MSPHARTLVLAAALSAGLAAPALAQGTPEQREACAPDAINLCSDTIPDEAKTKACMQRHLAQLSPKCRTVFLDATQPGDHRETHARREVAAPPPIARPVPRLAPPARDEADSDDPIAAYRASIAEDCREGLIDPFTCRNTMAVLRGE